MTKPVDGAEALASAMDDALIEKVARAIEPGPWNLLDFRLNLDDWQQAALDMSKVKARKAIAVAMEHAAQIVETRPLAFAGRMEVALRAGLAAALRARTALETRNG